VGTLNALLGHDAWELDFNSLKRTDTEQPGGAGGAEQQTGGTGGAEQPGETGRLQKKAGDGAGRDAPSAPSGGAEQPRGTGGGEKKSGSGGAEQACERTDLSHTLPGGTGAAELPGVVLPRDGTAAPPRGAGGAEQTVLSHAARHWYQRVPRVSKSGCYVTRFDLKVNCSEAG